MRNENITTLEKMKGKKHHWSYYQLNGKSPEENYADQREEFLQRATEINTEDDEIMDVQIIAEVKK